MEFFRKTNIDFMSKRHMTMAFTCSSLLILTSIGLMLFHGLNWG